MDEHEVNEAWHALPLKRRQQIIRWLARIDESKASPLDQPFPELVDLAAS